MKKQSLSNKALCILAAIVLFSLFLTGGCIIPFPHVKKTCDPLCGNVADSESNCPIKNAFVEVQYPDGGIRKTYTNEFGYFHFPKKKRFHWGIFFCVALNYSLPYDLYPSGISSLNINAEGYNTLLVYPVHFQNIYEKTEEVDTLFLEFNYLDCPNMYLSKKAILIEEIE